MEGYWERRCIEGGQLGGCSPTRLSYWGCV